MPSHDEIRLSDQERVSILRWLLVAWHHGSDTERPWIMEMVGKLAGVDKVVTIKEMK